MADNGIASTKTEEVEFFLDTTVAVLGATLTNGSIVNGKTTVTTAPVFAITTEELGAISPIIEFSTNGGSNWAAINTLSTLKAGDYTMIFHQIDQAGNTSVASAAVAFTLAADTPVPAVVGAVDSGVGHGNDGSGAGLSGSDFGW
jgi:hypothetical protein